MYAVGRSWDDLQACPYLAAADEITEGGGDITENIKRPE